MTASFWQKLPKPFFVLAPMANVTDSVFRKLIAKYGKPDVMWTEFVSADGLISAGKKNLLRDLDYSATERPIVAQLFTGHPEAMKKAAELVKKLKFDGLDINMGCPDRAVEKQGGGAAMMKDPRNTLKVIEAAREGVRWKKEEGKRKDIPVSVKTRIGYNKIDLEWIQFLLRLNLPALTIHLRTRKEMSDVPAHWELMPEIVKMRNEIQADIKIEYRTLLIGNGDVESIEMGRKLIKQSGCDGVMIGRGIFGKPWLFEKESGTRAPAERLKILLEHTKLFERTFCGKKHIKNFAVMKKHFKAYVNGWDGAKELRAKLMETNSYEDVAAVIKRYFILNT